MTNPRYDVVAIGNAIVDVLAHADDAFLATHGLEKGAMQLMEPSVAEKLYSAMGPGLEVSGGSAANTLAGIAALGHACAFIGQIRDDQLGAVFAHDIRAMGIDFDVPARIEEPPTGRCLILVSPDGHRTMNTSLGAAHYLPREAAKPELIADARYLYLEGYMWDPPEPRQAILLAIKAARAAGRKIALTLSVTFFIMQYRADFLKLIDDGLIDILFCNGEEAACLLEMDDAEAASVALAGRVPTLVVTHGADGASAFNHGERVDVPAEPIDKVVDTTGAGDLFAAGYLVGQIRGLSPQQSLKLGAICAAEIISHVGARPMIDLNALVAEKLG